MLCMPVYDRNYDYIACYVALPVQDGINGQETYYCTGELHSRVNGLSGRVKRFAWRYWQVNRNIQKT